ncbi:hypothetical protein GCM10023100_20580 [Actinocorallia cavernae]|uniref:Uncharacterized protein n=2 Tax=Actinomycetes TaxID=1760 RepID=A0ABN3N0V8_9ACTN
MSLTDVKIRSPRSDGAPDTPDPREAMRALPGFLRYPLTVFTGKPLTEQTRLGAHPAWPAQSAHDGLMARLGADKGHGATAALAG